jgi:CxxC-x17-CxxC domain-containing protein
MEPPRDEEVVCANCGVRFLFTGPEAAVYAARGLASPKRCKDCRRARKESSRAEGDARRGTRPRAPAPSGPPAARPASGEVDEEALPPHTGNVNEYRSPMQTGASNVGSSSGARRGPRGPSWSADGVYRAPSFNADRDAWMRNDARRERAKNPGRGDAPRDRPVSSDVSQTTDRTSRGRPARGAPRDRPMFQVTCSACGAQAEVPFKPAEGREVFCATCYRARRQRS